MSIHQQHEYKRPDSEFVSGDIQYIVPGNSGRLLDGRRTPGMIESYDPDSAMFIWRITGFEDKGKCWEIPADKIGSYQFERNSAKLTDEDAFLIHQKCNELDEKLIIRGEDVDYQKTRMIIENTAIKVKKWMKQYSNFIKAGDSKFPDNGVGDKDLYKDMMTYMSHYNLAELETKTAQQLVLNPNSGEWIKGLRIVMAEMGLIDFDEKIPRTMDIFKGIGTKKCRRKYIIHRMAFVQAFFQLLGIDKVTLYRGMSTSSKLRDTPRTILSTTYSLEVAQSFADLASEDEDVTYSYCVKFSYPVTNLFMTFFETREFNERYKEQEMLILYREKLYI